MYRYVYIYIYIYIYIVGTAVGVGSETSWTQAWRSLRTRANHNSDMYISIYLYIHSIYIYIYTYVVIVIVNEIVIVIVIVTVLVIVTTTAVARLSQTASLRGSAESPGHQDPFTMPQGDAELRRLAVRRHWLRARELHAHKSTHIPLPPSSASCLSFSRRRGANEHPVSPLGLRSRS